MESRHQHDTLDQIIEAAIIPHVATGSTARTREIAEAVRDALLAEGRIQQVAQPGWVSFPPPEETCLVIPLPVGVGCGNAKKDTP